LAFFKGEEKNVPSAYIVVKQGGRGCGDEMRKNLATAKLRGVYFEPDDRRILPKRIAALPWSVCQQREWRHGGN
jgi:hypothetical protein